MKGIKFSKKPRASKPSQASLPGPSQSSLADSPRSSACPSQSISDVNSLAAAALEAKEAGDLQTYDELSVQLKAERARVTSSHKSSLRQEIIDESAYTSQDYDRLGERLGRRRGPETKPKAYAALSSASCPYCIDSPEFNQSNFLAINATFYIAPSTSKILADGQLEIRPLSHSLSMTELEEDEISELKDLQRDVKRFYRNELGAQTLFCESVLNLDDCKHTSLVCYPLTASLLQDARAIFSNEFSQLGRRWADNERLTDTKARGIRAIPKGFSYIHVDFDGQGGFAHVIQDSRYYKKDLCSEVIGEVLGLDALSRGKQTFNQKMWEAFALQQSQH